LAKDPEFRPASLNLARIELGEGRYDEARRRLNGMLTKRHDDAEALFELGLLERRAGRAAEAIRHLHKAHEVQRRDVRPGMALIDTYLAQRQIEQALSSAIDLSSKYPDHLGVLLALGRTYLMAGNPGSARSVFKNATRLAEFDSVIQVEIARLQLAAGNSDGAYYSVEKALQGRPDDPAALALLIEIETRNGNAAKADEALKTLGARHPNRVETALARADLAMARNQYSAAIAAYRQALSREENTRNALKLARAHLVAGEAGKGAAFLESWVKNRPKDLVALKALAEMQFRSGQLPAARQSYAKALQSEPDDATTLNNYANLLLQLKDPAAQGQAEKALKLDPGNPAIADTLGWILVQQGQVEAGLRHLRVARLRSPDNGEIRFHLAYALSRSGRKEEARDELKAALSGAGKIEQNDAVKRLRVELDF
jgi:putative PEP-CTERM system TPR-repeat lipoprotein